MASTATSRLRLNKQGTYDNPETWGIELNNGMIDMVDQAFGGFSATITGNVSLTVQNYTSDQARRMFMMLDGAGGFVITVPAVDKAYLVINDCLADVTVTPLAGTGAVIRAGTAVWWYCDGTDGFVVDTRLNKILPPNGSVDFNSQKITGLAEPTLGTDGANKTYVDTFTADRSAGGFKLTNLADGVLGTDDAAPISQVVDLINASVAGLPVQTGSGAKFLQTDGTTATWQKVALNETSEVEGVLAVGNGGIGVGTLTANRILLGNGTSALAVVASEGTTAQVLTSNGPGVAPTFQALAGSGVVPIGPPVTLAVAAAAIDIALPSTYSQYSLRFSGFAPATSGSYVQVRLSINNGSSFIASGYAFGGRGFSGATGIDRSSTSTGAFDLTGDTMSNTLAGGACGIIELVLGSSTKPTFFTSSATALDVGATVLNLVQSGKLAAGGVPNMLRLLCSAGNVLAGITYQLYGHKDGV